MRGWGSTNFVKNYDMVREVRNSQFCGDAIKLIKEGLSSIVRNVMRDFVNQNVSVY